MFSRYRLVLLVLFVYLCTFASSDRTGFWSLTTCNCLEQNVTYECTVSGGAFTVWSGSAFRCQGEEIPLRHVGFLTAIGECNNGAVIARGIEVSNNCYTSRLSVRLGHELIGRSITCSVDIDSNLIAVGTGNLTVSTHPFPPPSGINIERIGPNQIMFIWSAVPSNIGCPSFFYNISAINCGMCYPNITTSTSSICTNFTSTPLSMAITEDPCNFTVQSVICENITGDMNYHLVTLAVPDAPVVQSVPHYAFRTANFIRLVTIIKVVESFNISTDQGIDGSATNYTIVYAESPSGKICDSATILPSSCEAGTCSHTFEVSSSSCSPSSIITTSAFATNILGNGSISTITGDGHDTFVDVRFDTMTKTFLCTFLNQSMFMDRKSCIANITYGINCNQHLGSYPAAGVGSFIITPTIEFISEESFYCIFINASNGNQTVIIEGTLDLVNIGQQSTTAAIVSSVVVIICIIAAMISIIVIWILYTRKSQVRIIKFTTSKTSSLSDVLQVFKNHGVSVLSVNTHLHHTGINLETKQGLTDNYIFCICSLRHKTELQSKLEKFNVEFFEESASNQDDRSGSALIKRTVKVSVRNPGDILEILGVFNEKGIQIIGVNTSTGDNSIVCQCSKQEEKKILEALKKLPTDSTDFISIDVDHVSRSKSTSTRRIEFLVRPEASDIARALKVFGDCGVNITEINRDYVKEFNTATPQPVILEAHNLVECVCKEEIQEQLFAKLQEYQAVNIRRLPKTDLPSRNNVNQDYCVVAFSVIHEVGSLARALKAFADLNINILGLNTLGCPDHSTLQHHLNHKRCKVEFMLLTKERQTELIKEIQATGIVVESISSMAEQAAAETSSLQLLILEEDENEKKMSMPKALQTMFSVFQMLDITIFGYELDRNSTCQRQYQRNHVEYTTNAEEEGQMLIKELTATGIVKVLNDFSIDDNKPFIQNVITCM